MTPDLEIVGFMSLALVESVENFINNPTDQNELIVLANTVKLKNYVVLHTDDEPTEIGDDEDSADSDKYLLQLDKVMMLKAELDNLINTLPIYLKPFICIYKLFHRFMYRGMYGKSR